MNAAYFCTLHNLIYFYKSKTLVAKPEKKIKQNKIVTTQKMN